MDRTKATDADLIEASRRGERAAFGELVERCARMVSAVSYAATRDRSLSEDITQDTFVAAWCALHRLRDATVLRPWLCRIARNLASKARRPRARAVVGIDVLVDERTPFDAVRESQVERVVADSLARIPDVYREALVLFYYEQRSARDVALALGVTEKVVHKRLSRGRKHLAAGIETLVEDHLERRRSRRDVATAVLAALPLAPSHVATTAAKGPSNMFGLGTIGIVIVAIGAGSAGALPRVTSATPGTHQSTHPTPAPVTQRPSPRRVTTPPQLPRRLDCATAARHIVDLALQHVHGTPERVRDETSRLETECRDNEWSQGDMKCVVAAPDMAAVRACTGEDDNEVVEVAPPLPARSSGDCKMVGKHVADLVIASMAGTRQDNVEASLLVDTAEIPASIEANCANEPWSDSQRRCYAAATSMLQFVACNRR